MNRMSDTLKILEKAMNRSNGKAKIVDVPAERTESSTA